MGRYTIPMGRYTIQSMPELPTHPPAQKLGRYLELSRQPADVRPDRYWLPVRYPHAAPEPDGETLAPPGPPLRDSQTTPHPVA
jgi:hypothetical protein